MPTYRIRIRDVNLKFVGEVTDYISLQYIIRMNARGKWVLTLPYSSESVQTLLGLLVDGNKGVGGIYVERDGQYLFSGPLLDHEYYFDRETGEIMSFIGADEMDFIERALALPRPLRYQSPYMNDGNGHHTFYMPEDRTIDPNSVSMSSSEVFYNIYRLNVGQSASSSRKIPQVYIKFNVGSSNDVGSERYPSGNLNVFPNPNPVVCRGEGMMEILEQITNYSESTVYNPDGSVWKPPHPFIMTAAMKYDPSLGTTYGGWWIVLEAKACPDKTSAVVFSKEQGNVLSIRRTKTAPEANLILMAGSGDGANRVFAYSGDEPSRRIYGDREGFREFDGFKYSQTDQTQKEQLESLKPVLYDELRLASSQTIIEAEVVSIDGMEYHKDWFVGDKVRVKTPVGTDDVIIREVEVTVTAATDAATEAGETVTVGLGTAPAPLYNLNDSKKTALHTKWIQNKFKSKAGGV